ncbi:MAG: zf-HC2 domain-containing protein [Gemmatimonadales bacterium]
MSDQLTCDRVDREDLDTRYLAGTLGEADAAAFEAHFFECERCWRLVRHGAEIRSAGPEASSPAARSGPARWRWRWAVVPLAAAAALLVWVTARAPVATDPGSDSPVRGTGDSLNVATATTGGVLVAAWSRVAEAASYQVRLFSADGALVWERRATDTSVSVPRDSIPGTTSGGLFWQVQALDLIGAPLVRSPLVEVPRDSTAR